MRAASRGFTPQAFHEAHGGRLAERTFVLAAGAAVTLGAELGRFTAVARRGLSSRA